MSQNARFLEVPRVAKYFAEKHNYKYIGFEEDTLLNSS